MKRLFVKDVHFNCFCSKVGQVFRQEDNFKACTLTCNTINIHLFNKSHSKKPFVLDFPSRSCCEDNRRAFDLFPLWEKTHSLKKKPYNFSVGSKLYISHLHIIVERSPCGTRWTLDLHFPALHPSSCLYRSLAHALLLPHSCGCIKPYFWIQTNVNLFG